MKCEAYNNSIRQWQEAEIIQQTPKSRNYPQGGFYIRWAGKREMWESSGGWHSPRTIRNIQGNTETLPMANY